MELITDLRQQAASKLDELTARGVTAFSIVVGGGANGPERLRRFIPSAGPVDLETILIDLDRVRRAADRQDETRLRDEAIQARELPRAEQPAETVEDIDPDLAARLAESAAAAQFRQTDSGRLERIIELLEAAAPSRG